MEATNPLLDTAGLPQFEAVRAEHIAPAIEDLLGEAERALSLATSDVVPADYDALSAVLDVATERLGRAWAAVGHLNAVADTPALRAAYTDNLPKVVDFYTRLGADERLFAKYKAVLADPRSARLPALSPARTDQRAARFQAFRRRARGCSEGAPCRAARPPSRDRPEVLGARARRDRRLRVLRPCQRARGRAR